METKPYFCLRENRGQNYDTWLSTQNDNLLRNVIPYEKILYLVVTRVGNNVYLYIGEQNDAFVTRQPPFDMEGYRV